MDVQGEGFAEGQNQVWWQRDKDNGGRNERLFTQKDEAGEAEDDAKKEESVNEKG